MKWTNHDKWASKLDVSKEASREVNEIVDAIDDRQNVPERYKDELDRIRAEIIDEKEVAKSKSIFHAVVKKDDGHDSARDRRSAAKIHAETQRRFFQRMGENYVKAWYLHHYLDFLSEEQGSEKEIPELLSEYRQKYPQVRNDEIEQFILKHEQELENELGLT